MRRAKRRAAENRPLPEVALVIEAPNSYTRAILVGVGEYILTHGPWRVRFAVHAPGDGPPAWLHGWSGQGIIFRSGNHRVAQAIAELAVPVVDVSASWLVTRAPWIKSDDLAIGRLAAAHFLERGFRNFAYCGNPGHSCSDARQASFAAEVSGAGHRLDVYSASRDASGPAGEAEEIGNWLSRLPKPVAVFTSSDQLGQRVLDACHGQGLQVPEQVAVLGVDNDEVLCALSPPPLSSIILNAHRTGWDAAALLDGLMRGENLLAEAHLVSPIGIATRQSSEILAVHDPAIAAALHYIREHARDGIRVSDVVRHSSLSRRTLELRFQALLGRSPRQEIVRVQLNVVKELLSGTNLSLAEIAGRTGFEHPEYLSVVFKREIGITASAYRAGGRQTPASCAKSHPPYASAHS